MGESTNAHLDKICTLSQTLESLDQSAAFERVTEEHLTAESGTFRLDDAKIPVELIPEWIRDSHDLAPRFAISGFQASILRDTTIKPRAGTWTISANYSLNELPYSFWTNGNESWMNRTDYAGDQIKINLRDSGRIAHFMGSIARGLLINQHGISSAALIGELPKPESDDYTQINELLIAIAGLRGRYQLNRKSLLMVPQNPDGVGAVYIKQSETVQPTHKDTNITYHMLSFNEYDPDCTLLTVSNTRRRSAKESIMKKQYALERRIPLITAEDLQLEIDLDLLDDPSTTSKATPFKPNDPDFLFESASARIMQALQPAIAKVRYLDSNTRLPDNAEDTLGYTPPEFS